MVYPLIVGGGLLSSAEKDSDGGLLSSAEKDSDGDYHPPGLLDSKSKTGKGGFLWSFFSKKVQVHVYPNLQTFFHYNVIGGQK